MKSKELVREKMAENSEKPFVKLGVLLSGGGRTLKNILEYIERGDLNAEVKVVISSRSDAYGLVRAKNHGIQTHVVERKRYSTPDEFSNDINSILDRYDVDLVVMAGFLSLFKASDKYRGRVMNIHPALIPSFCGHGYYGHRVHEAVLNYGAKISGATVHFADEKYDNGPIILQSSVPVLDNDTPDSLAERIFQEECKIYPRAIQLFAERRLKIEDRRVRILDLPQKRS